jgi:peroxiredoxin
MRPIPHALVLALGFSGFVAACGGPRPLAAPPPVGGPGGRTAETVDFELADARGQAPVRLSDFRGRPVVVHFFTTWCAPCEAEFQNLNALSAAHADAGDLAIIGVAMDLDGKKLLPVFLEVRGLAYPVLLADERMLHGETPFGPVRAIPATFLVDAAGRHVESFQGVVPYEHLKARLAPLLTHTP